MADQIAKRDDNRIPGLLGVTDDANADLTRLLVDSNGRLKVSAIIAGYGTGSDATATTADATPTQIDAISVSEGYAYYVNAVVIAKEGDTNRAVFHISGLFYRASGGNVTQQGATQVRTILKSDDNWDVDFSADTVNQQIDLQITGKAATTISWESYITYYEV